MSTPAKIEIVSPVTRMLQIEGEDPISLSVLHPVTRLMSVAVQGPTGPQGPEGPQGPRGPQGPPGTGGTGGGGETPPTFPILSAQSFTNLAAGASVTFTSPILLADTTGKLQQVTLSSSVACKWEIGAIAQSIPTLFDVVMTSGISVSPSYDWTPAHKDYATVAGDGIGAAFRVVVTSCDGRNAANVYVTFYMDEVANP